MSDLQIITLTLADWEHYKARRLEALRTDPQAFGASYEENLVRPDSWWQRRLADAAEDGGSWMLFASDGRRLVGMIGALVKQEPSVAEIIAMYVSPRARRRGVATLLLRSILQELERDSSIVAARLRVNPAQIAAVVLYEKCGFHRITKKPDAAGHGELPDAYVMEQPLRER